VHLFRCEFDLMSLACLVSLREGEREREGKCVFAESLCLCVEFIAIYRSYSGLFLDNLMWHVCGGSGDEDLEENDG